MEVRITMNSSRMTPPISNEYWIASTRTGSTFKYKPKREASESDNFSNVYRK